MLIEFRVSNYRSFDEEVVFSMAAAPRLRTLKGNTHHTPEMAALGVPPLLKVATIYGPNASGKSNLLLALDAMSRLVLEAASVERLGITPHRYVGENATRPTKFQLSFLTRQESKLQTYELEIWTTSKRIVKEQLWCREIDAEMALYSRIYDTNKHVDIYEFSKLLEGGIELHKIWQKLTPPNALFLSKAANSSSEQLTQLKSPYLWLLMFLSVTTSKDQHSIQRGLLQFLTMRSNELRTYDLARIAQFISDFDIPISKITLKKRGEEYEVTLTHQIAGQSYDFDLSEESEGTRNLFFLAMAFAHSNELAQTLIFDELDNSLHPLIVRKLVAVLSKNNIGTQLIFTTHDTRLMDSKVLRRDQFWLMERDRKGASRLCSIYDYKGREGEDLEKRYYEGKYRALPILMG